jgi:hypothetical protein
MFPEEIFKCQSFSNVDSCIPVIPVLQRQRQENQEFTIQPAWAMEGDPVTTAKT